MNLFRKLTARSGAVALFVLWINCSPASLAATNDAGRLPRSPAELAASADGKRIYVAEETGHSIAVVEDGKLSGRFTLPGAPTGICLDGDSLWVTIDDNGSSLLLGLDGSGSINARIPCGAGAMAPVVETATRRIYVANKFADSVSAIDLTSGKELARVPVTRMPCALARDPRSGRLFAAGFMPEMPANLSHVAAAVSIIDPKSLKTAGRVLLPNGSTALRDLALSPDGRYLLAIHSLARFQVPVSQLEQGWVSTNALSLIDLQTLKLAHTVLLDERYRGAPAPWAMTFDKAGHMLLITHAGTHDVSIIDYPALIGRLELKEASSAESGFSTLSGIRQRVALPGNSPRSIVRAGDSFAVAEYYSDSLGFIEFAPSGRAGIRQLQLNPGMIPSKARLGEMLFHDASNTYQNWLSCSTCHLEGRTDGLNWDLLGDGIGNPLNTKSLLLAHETLPMGYTGSRALVAGSTHSSFKYILNFEAGREITDAVDAYIQSLEPRSLPITASRDTAARIDQGRRLFAGKARCTDCHSGVYFTDLKVYDMKNAGPLDQTSSWDTPSLVEIWRTAPYLHDGRAATLEDVLVAENHGGASDLLNASEIQALVAYLRRL